MTDASRTLPRHCPVCGSRRRWWHRSPCHIEASTHDLGVLAGGAWIHYTTCWCRKNEPGNTSASGEERAPDDGSANSR